jgi:hypothetical protein
MWQRALLEFAGMSWLLAMMQVEPDDWLSLPWND